jgi:multiple sugar transport system permease protein
MIGKVRHPVLSYALLVAASAVAIGPLLWMAATSLKTSAAILAVPPQWFPNPVATEHYEVVVQGSQIGRYFWNTVVVTGCSIALSLIVAAHAAYGAVRFSFRGRSILLFVLLATSMIPGIALLAPLYALSTRLYLYDTYIGLILAYSAWQTPTAIWLMRGFIEGVPREIDEAALVDGCSPYQVFCHMMIPLIRPGLAAAAIIMFVQIWNDFLFATALTISEDVRTLQIGLYRYMGDTGIEWGRLAAYTTLSALPIVVIFLWLQRRFIEGLTAGAAKG